MSDLHTDKNNKLKRRMNSGMKIEKGEFFRSILNNQNPNKMF